MEDYKQHKNWFQRNWKWLLPALILIISIPIIQSPLGNAAKDFGSLYLNPAIYENALDQVRANQEATELLGTPIETLFLVEGEVMYSDDGNSATMTIPIKGSETKGRMDVQANKINGEWVYRLIRIRTKKPKAQIEVLKIE